MKEPIHIISLGAGVQSSTMALMAAKGEITPMPTCAVFSDVRDSEPPSVAKWLDWLEPQLPFPLYRVSRGSLYADLLKACKTGSRVASIPAHTKFNGIRYYCEDCGTPAQKGMPCDECGGLNQNERAENNEGILWRQCTGDYKLAPLTKQIREIRGKNEAVVWIGISLDEVMRCKESKIKGVTHRWPLIDVRMSRHDCLRWMENNGYPKPPRSSCFFCPYHSDAEWRRLKTEEPESFRAAADLDAKIRNSLPNVTSEVFLHPSRKPLSEVDFSTDEERGQVNLFNNECEGLCGV